MTDAAVIPCRYVIGDLRRCNTGGVAGRTVVRVDTYVAVRNTRKGREIGDVMARRAIQICRQVIQ